MINSKYFKLPSAKDLKKYSDGAGGYPSAEQEWGLAPFGKDEDFCRNMNEKDLALARFTYDLWLSKKLKELRQSKQARDNAYHASHWYNTVNHEELKELLEEKRQVLFQAIESHYIDRVRKGNIGKLSDEFLQSIIIRLTRGTVELQAHQPTAKLKRLPKLIDGNFVGGIESIKALCMMCFKSKAKANKLVI